jgi:hypothetical protein
MIGAAIIILWLPMILSGVQLTVAGYRGQSADSD